MATYSNGAVKVGNKPTLICTVPPGNSTVTLQNVGAAPVFVGGPAVSGSGANQGIRVDVDEKFSLPSMDPDANDLYAVAEDGDAAVVFLY